MTSVRPAILQKLGVGVAVPSARRYAKSAQRAFLYDLDRSAKCLRAEGESQECGRAGHSQRKPSRTAEGPPGARQVQLFGAHPVGPCPSAAISAPAGEMRSSPAPHLRSHGA
jgi:hypothetical protein